MKKIYVNTYLALGIIAVVGIGAAFLILNTADKLVATENSYAEVQASETQHGHEIITKVRQHSPLKHV